MSEEEDRLASGFLGNISTPTRVGSKMAADVCIYILYLYTYIYIYICIYIYVYIVKWLQAHIYTYQLPLYAWGLRFSKTSSNEKSVLVGV